MDKFAKLLESKAKSQKPMMGPEKDAKLRAVQEMRQMASDEMAMPLKNLKKVTVASDSPKGLSEGLEKAEDIVEGSEGMMEEGMEMGEEKLPEEMSPEELEAKIQELQELLAVKKMP